MSAHLLIIYPTPKDAAKFDRAYLEEHLPYAGPRLEGATSVKTQRVVGPAFAPPTLPSDVRCQLPDARRLEGLRRFEEVERKHWSMPHPSVRAARPC